MVKMGAREGAILTMINTASPWLGQQEVLVLDKMAFSSLMAFFSQQYRPQIGKRSFACFVVRLAIQWQDQ